MAEVKCKECGWEGDWKDVGYKTVYEDWGDVSCLVCPNCKQVEYEGMELLVEVEDDRKA